MSYPGTQCICTETKELMKLIPKLILFFFPKSFVIGFGNNYPLRPHHASSSCPDAPAPCDWTNFGSSNPNSHVLYGALVGGPNATDDKYIDDRTGNYLTLSFFTIILTYLNESRKYLHITIVAHWCFK